MVVNYSDNFMGARPFSNLTATQKTTVVPTLAIVVVLSACFPLGVLTLKLVTDAWVFFQWWCNGIVVLSVLVNILALLAVGDTTALLKSKIAICAAITISIFVPVRMLVVGMAVAVISIIDIILTTTR